MKGILFRPWKIEAIADSPLDREWQTRRGIKPQPYVEETTPNSLATMGNWSLLIQIEKNLQCKEYFAWSTFYRENARYQVGEVVYIKEAHATEKVWDDKPLSFLANASEVPLWYQINDPLVSDFVPCGRWRNPRAMPAWAARHFIRITGVRAERTRDISFEDCLAEGIVGTKEWCELAIGGNYKPPEPLNPDDNSNEAIDQEIDRGWTEYARQAYFRLYDSINGKGAHERNWDFVYSFVRCNKD